MALVKNKTNDANREYWSHVEEVAKEVGKWPRWMSNSKETSNKEEEQENIRARAANASGSSVSDDK
jgi:hypothetical protein